MKQLIISLIITISTLTSLSASSDLINIKSNNSVQETVNKFVKIIKSKGVKIFAQIDHAKGTRNIGKELRDTQLVIFGSPKMGAPIMNINQTIGLDLPLKVLFWKDAKGITWITYRKPKSIFVAHDVKKDKIQNKMTKVLAMFSKKAAN